MSGSNHVLNQQSQNIRIFVNQTDVLVNEHTILEKKSHQMNNVPLILNLNKGQYDVRLLQLSVTLQILRSFTCIKAILS